MDDHLSRLPEELRIVRASRDRYRSLVDSLPVGVALMDRSFRVVSANRAFACFVGRDVRDVAGLDLAMAFGVEKGDLQAVSMLPEGGSWGLSLRVPRQEGGERCLDVTFSADFDPAGLVSVFALDATERTKLEVQHEELLRHLPVGAFRATMDGDLILLNPEGRAVLEMDHGPVSLAESLGPRDWNWLREKVDRDGKARLLARKTGASGNRLIFQVDARKTVSFGETWISGSIEDITRRIEMEELLVSALEEAEAASRAKGTFLAQMSHELRTPLNAVCGIAEILDAYVPDGEGRGLLSDLSAAARHLTSLIGDVLDFSKIESGKLVIEDKDFDLMRIFRELEGSFAAQARIKGISFTLAIDPPVPRVFRGDPLRVKQILYNLVGNAFKFVNEGLVAVTARYEVDESGESPRMVISVADTGPGIPEDRSEAVFSPFEQTEHGRKAGGTGLGLSISRELARLMGGDITLKSRCGHGTTFTVTLALPEGDPSGITGDERSSTVVSGGRALVVDDIPLNRKVLRLFLQKDGWTVAEAGSGEEALSILAMDADFDMIFMDISMPGMDGMEVTRRIRDLPNHGRIPVVAVTAHALAGDRERFLAAGMDGYVVKPVRLEHVRNEIARLLSAPAAASTRLAGAGPSPVSRDDSSQPLDLVALVATCQGNEELARELIEDLLRELDGWVREVDDRLQAGDLGGVRKICHLIRGTASTVAAGRLAQAAGDLGGMIREERLGGIPEGHLRLRAAVRELRDWWAALSFSEPSRWPGPGMTPKRAPNLPDTPAPSP